MTRAHDLLRALRYRWGSSLLILVLAVVAVAAATVGPTYNNAGRTSIVQDTFSSAPGIEQGVDVTESGSITSILGGLQASVLASASRGLGGAAAEDQVLGTPIDAMVANAEITAPNKQVMLAWRTGTCAHLRLVAGSCPQASRQIMISPSLAIENDWHVGTKVAAAPFGTLVVTGIYAIPAVNLAYWSVTSSTFFGTEEAGGPRGPIPDAAFTTEATMKAAPAQQQGTDTVDLVVNVPAVTSANLDRLDRTTQSLLNDEDLFDQQAVVQTEIPDAIKTIHSSWNTLSTPVLVVTGELLILVWLLLFLVVVDAVETRGAEVALARLRGYGRRRAVVVAVAEPVTVLSAALPIGALLGWWIATELGHSLRPGTPIPLIAASWIAAGIATLGGIAAVLTAARRVVRRPVVEQWRRTSRGATRRGWVVDAILLTAAAGGLAQLASSGAFATSGSDASSHHSVALLVPALMGVAVAVVTSRLLPLICRAAFGFTRHRGGLASFLAVRHVARRPGGTRTLIVLVTAFTLATFATLSWSIARDNRHRVADVATGSATVFTVTPVTAPALISAVDDADPTGRHAAAVLAYYAGSSTLLAVQPQRFAHVAAWAAAGAPQPHDLAQISPAAPPPIVFNGQAIRVRLHVNHLNAPVDLAVDVVVANNAPPTRVDLGLLTTKSGTVTRTATLDRCPCRLADLDLTPTATSTQLQGDVGLESIDQRRNGTWQAMPDITVADHWHPAASADSVTATAGKLSWSFATPPTNDTLLAVDDHPVPLPVVAAQSLSSDGGALNPSGLDGGALPVTDVDAVSAVPGAPATGVVVDLDYAERAALDGDASAQRQVWVTSGEAQRIAKSLATKGIRVLTTTRAANADAQLLRQGPGLAGSLFLLDAAAAALLAALGAVVGLAISARRRRYEYAALAAGGVPQRVLRRSLAIEQLLVLVMGAVVGVATGVLATIVSVRSVPEFVIQPLAPQLHYAPSGTVSIAVLAGAIALLLAVSLVASRALLSAAKPSLLREPPA